MRLMTCSECESTRLIVLFLLHRCASTSNQDRSQQSGSIAASGIHHNSRGGCWIKERQVEGVQDCQECWLVDLD
ncbi:MAG: hypothetical protein J3Q66DRAFT_348763, partial [Benniella sp.]